MTSSQQSNEFMRKTVSYPIGDSGQHIWGVQIGPSDILEGKKESFNASPCFVNLLSFLSLLPNTDCVDVLLPDYEVRLDNVDLWALYFSGSRSRLLFGSDTFKLSQNLTLFLEQLHLAIWKEVPGLKNNTGKGGKKSLLRQSTARYIEVGHIARYLKLMKPFLVARFPTKGSDGGGGGATKVFPHEFFDKLLKVFAKFDSPVGKALAPASASAASASAASAAMDVSLDDEVHDTDKKQVLTAPKLGNSKKRKAKSDSIIDDFDTEGDAVMSAAEAPSVAGKSELSEPIAKKTKSDLLDKLSELEKRFTERETEMKRDLENLKNFRQITENKLNDKQKIVDSLRDAVVKEEQNVENLMDRFKSLLDLEGQLMERRKEVERKHSELIKKMGNI